MYVASLPANVLDKLKTWHWDRIIEKHEGPETWESVLRYYDPEFMQIAQRDVLLPIGRDQHPNVTILRTIVSDDGQTLTLKDTTYVDNPKDEFFMAGFVAICDRFPSQDFYVAILYHEWFMVEN